MTVTVEWVGANHKNRRVLLWGHATYKANVHDEQGDLFSGNSRCTAKGYVFWGTPGHLKFANNKYRTIRESSKLKYPKAEVYEQTVKDELGMFVLDKILKGTFK